MANSCTSPAMPVVASRGRRVTPVANGRLVDNVAAFARGEPWQVVTAG
ncbi:hypothetical protein [Burkholderia metallica]|nr:hypothetical protein [Burkholderia metallica]